MREIREGRVLTIAISCVALMLSAAASGARAATERYVIERRSSAASMKLLRDAAIPPQHVVADLQHLDIVIADLDDDAVARLRKTPGFLRIEREREYQPLGRTTVPLARFQNEQVRPYGIDLVNAPKVWGLTQGAGVKVGVIDTGIDSHHPDLVDRVKGGFDFGDNDSDPFDADTHGTHVAGIIAASDNGVGVVGVAPKAELYALKVFRDSGPAKSGAVLQALDWAIAHQLQIVNLSIGSPEPSGIEEDAFKKLADAGILAIAASGNDYETLQLDGVVFPAGYSTVMAVGAVDRDRRVAFFSQRGKELSLVAPGIGVLSTVPLGSAQMAEVDIGGAKTIAATIYGSPRATLESALVFCGEGAPEEFPAEVSGKVALINGAHYYYWEKVANAKAKGAIGTVVFREKPGDISNGTMIIPEKSPARTPSRAGDPPYPTDPAYQWLPAMIVDYDTGMQLKSGGGSVHLEFGLPDDYDSYMGTSMSAPHVAGVAALLWSLDPNLTRTQLRELLQLSAHDEGDAGFDKVYGFGLVDALAAARIVSPGSFPTPPRHRSVRH